MKRYLLLALVVLGLVVFSPQQGQAHIHFDVSIGVPAYYGPGYYYGYPGYDYAYYGPYYYRPHFYRPYYYPYYGGYRPYYYYRHHYGHRWWR